MPNIEEYVKNYAPWLFEFSMPIVGQNQLKVFAIVALCFLLVLVLAGVRKYLVKSTLQSGFIGIGIGFALALVLEGFMLLSGNTFITGFLGWQNAPKPVLKLVEDSRQRMVNVLGLSTTDPSVDDALGVVQSLDPSEINKFKNIICSP